MTILIPNFKGTQTAALTVKGQYKKSIDGPSFACVNNLDGQLYRVFNLDSEEITISKIGHTGLLKTSDFSLVK